MKKLMNLILIQAAFLVSNSFFFWNAEPKSFLGSDWIPIGNSTRVEIKKDSIVRQGDTVLSTFAFFFYDSDSRNQYLSVKGQRTDDCSRYSFQNDSIKVHSAVIFNLEGKRVIEKKVSREEIDSFEYNRYLLAPYHSKMLHRYLCNDIKPSYLKPGMNILEAKNLLYKHHFKIVEQYPGAVQHNRKDICDTSKPCIVCGNGWAGCFIEFRHVLNSSRVNLSLDYGVSTVIDSTILSK